MWFAVGERKKLPECIFPASKNGLLPFLQDSVGFCDIPYSPLLTNICLIFLPFHAHTRYYPCI